MRPSVLVLASMSVAILVAACSTDTSNAGACYPGDFVRVTLADGGAGFERCAADGGGYEPYDGPDPNVPTAACVPIAGEPLGFMCTGCTHDTDCETGLTCFPFTNKGPHCTHRCSGASDCPPPSGGCGNQGVCKP